MAGKGPTDGPETQRRALEAALEAGRAEAPPEEVAAADERLEELLEQVEVPPSATTPIAPAALAPASTGDLDSLWDATELRTGVAQAMEGRRVTVRLGGRAIEVEVAPGVSLPLIADAVREGQRLLLERAGREAPMVVGVVQTREPTTLRLRARELHLEGDEEVLVRSGYAAIRLRKDGDVELVGSRVSAMSRGLFRLVGRMLRLN